MWKRIQFILAMFHGQADVGRGFNVNKELLVENMHEASTVSSLISQRQVYNHIKSKSIETHPIKVTKELLQKQPFISVPKKRCSENMQQIYRRTPMPVFLELY